MHKIIDLGDYWEKVTGNAIPLGGIVIKRDIDDAVKNKVDALIKESIAYAWLNYPVLNDYIRTHSQEMSEEVMRKHINLYVNEYSSGLGIDGKNAVSKLLDVYNNSNEVLPFNGPVFLPG